MMSRRNAYISSFIIHAFFSILFLDYVDGYVFLETARNILVNRTGFYSETGYHALFNYFPLAFLPVLAGSSLYLVLGINNLLMQRFFLKLPFIASNILLAWLIHRYSIQRTELHVADIIEQLILFNPLLIYISAIKGQFDAVIAVYVVLHWIAIENKKYLTAGICAAVAFLLKIHGAFLPFFVFCNLLKESPRSALKLLLSAVITTILILVPFILMYPQALLQHSIVYHITRPPNGFSVTALIHHILVLLLDKPEQAITILLAVSTIVLILVLAYAARQAYNATNSNQILDSTNVFFITFLLLNKVFWLQYAAIPLTIHLLQNKDWDLENLKQWRIWSIAFIPVAVMFRLIEMVPEDIQKSLGSNWITILWTTSLLAHLFLLFLFRNDIQWNRKVKIIYAIFLFLLPFHYAVMIIAARYRF